MLLADSGFPASASSTSVRRVACELAPVRPIRADSNRPVAHVQRGRHADDGEMRRALIELGVGGGTSRA